jgi:hypothetical protein
MVARPPSLIGGFGMARAKRLAILAVTVVLLGGCGGSGTTSTPSSATGQQPSGVATPALTPSSAPTASSSPALAALASQYTVVSDRGNAAIVQCDKAKADANGDLDKSKTAAKECLTAYTEYVAGLKAVNWGPTQPKVDAVIAAMNKIDTLVAQLANETSEAAFTADYEKLAPAELGLLVAANALRAALGLPPVK